MFHAFVSICAAALIHAPDSPICIEIDDTWGPYRSLEHCNIRTDQMVDELLEGQLRDYTLSELGQPKDVVVTMRCTRSLEAGRDA